MNPRNVLKTGDDATGILFMEFNISVVTRGFDFKRWKALEGMANIAG